MMYRNTKNGAIIETPCEVSSEHWEKVEKQKKETTKKGTAQEEGESEK